MDYTERLCLLAINDDRLADETSPCRTGSGALDPKFALTYYIIQTTDPTQFVDLATRTDAHYYTVITLGTVGYGDVHAAGQLARVISMIQVAFDLVVIGALIAVAASRFQVVPHRTRIRPKTDTEMRPPAGFTLSG